MHLIQHKRCVFSKNTIFAINKGTVVYKVKFFKAS